MKDNARIVEDCQNQKALGLFGYGKRYTCPPDTATPEQTQAVIDCYQRAILFHIESIPGSKKKDWSRVQKFFDMLVDLGRGDIQRRVLQGPALSGGPLPPL
jgi:predicted metal-binding protein